MDYEVVYETDYITPGFVLYNTDYTQFAKMFSNRIEGGPSYTFIVSDNVEDRPENYFRTIDFEIEAQNPLYQVFLEFHTFLKRDVIFSMHPLQEGYNQLRIEKTEQSIKISFIKDLRHSKNLTSNILTLNVTDPSFEILYRSFLSVGVKENKKILEKMINLKAN